MAIYIKKQSFAELVKNPDINVRIALAKREDLPEEFVRILADDHNGDYNTSKIRTAIAQRSSRAVKKKRRINSFKWQ